MRRYTLTRRTVRIHSGADEWLTPFTWNAGERRPDGLGGSGAAADSLPQLPAFALAGLLIMLFSLERLEDAFTLKHALKAPQRLFERLIITNFNAWHMGVLIDDYRRNPPACQLRPLVVVRPPILP